MGVVDCVSVRVCVCAFVCVCVSVGVSVCVCVCVCHTKDLANYLCVPVYGCGTLTRITKYDGLAHVL